MTHAAVAPETRERPVRRVDHLWIPAADGVRLAARLWLPPAAGETPAPAILEYSPYRKDDYLAARDEKAYAYLAARGLACVRVDVRGSGSSEGLLTDEYGAAEREDALAVLEWMAAQRWCAGAVGMMGISWSGFAALHAAAREGSPLRAAVVVCASDDRFGNDAHYEGGTVLASELLPWATRMLAYGARPPDPHVVGERWRELWEERLRQVPPFVERWLAHQRRDAYWREGSICDEGYERVRCPVLLVGGWADPYRTGLLRLLERLPGPRRALIGPWAHMYPHRGAPGPAVGFLDEAARWFRHWLGGEETGVMEEPLLRAWMPSPGEDAGRWIGEREWPSRRVQPHRLHLGAGSLAPEPARPQRLSHRTPQSVGTQGGAWCPDGSAVELPGDQRPDDARSLVFEWAPLDEVVEILGSAVVELEVTVDRPVALVAARLCDVAPDGRSTLVGRAHLNLTRRDGDADASPAPVGEPLRVRLELPPTAHAFGAGHRIRLSLSGASWPFAWPPPDPVELVVHAGAASRLDLPVRPRSGDAPALRLPPAAHAEPPELESLAPAHVERVDRTRDGRTEVLVHRDLGSVLLPEHADLEIAHVAEDRVSIRDDDPLSAEVESLWRISYRRPGWDVRVRVRGTMRCDAQRFHVRNELEAREAGDEVASWVRAASFPRDLL